MLDISEEWIKKGGRNYGRRDKLSKIMGGCVDHIQQRVDFMSNMQQATGCSDQRMMWSKVAKHHSGCE